MFSPYRFVTLHPRQFPRLGDRQPDAGPCCSPIPFSQLFGGSPWHRVDWRRDGRDGERCIQPELALGRNIRENSYFWTEAGECLC